MLFGRLRGNTIAGILRRVRRSIVTDQPDVTAQSNAPVGHAGRHLDTRTGVIQVGLVTDAHGAVVKSYIEHPAPQRRSRSKSNSKCQVEVNSRCTES